MLHNMIPYHQSVAMLARASRSVRPVEKKVGFLLFATMPDSGEKKVGLKICRSFVKRFKRSAQPVFFRCISVMRLFVDICFENSFCFRNAVLSCFRKIVLISFKNEDQTNFQNEISKHLFNTSQHGSSKHQNDISKTLNTKFQK